MFKDKNTGLKPHRTMVQARHMALSILLIGLFLATLPLLIIAGQDLESYYFPVTTNVKFTLLKEDKDRMIFHVTGNKQRNCRLSDVRVLVDRDGPEGFQDPIRGVIYNMANDGPTDLPLGQQDFGTWSVQPIGKQIQLQTWYRCHWLWETTTNLGQWPMSQEKKIP